MTPLTFLSILAVCVGAVGALGIGYTMYEDYKILRKRAAQKRERDAQRRARHYH